MVPAIVLMLPLYVAFSQAGLRNTLGGLLLVYPATTIPVALYMLQGYFKGIPKELEEAGRVDGLSLPGILIKITFAAITAGFGQRVAVCVHDRLERVSICLHVPRRSEDFSRYPEALRA